jgi:ferredoxin
VALRARVDKLSCQSSGRCIDAAPELFSADADHLAEVRVPAPAAANERLLRIARDCPAMAIALFDEKGREVDLYGEEA